MKTDWKKVKLGEVCLKIGSGATPNGVEWYNKSAVPKLPKN